MLFKIKICKTLPNIYVLSYLHQKEVTCISIKIGFSIDELRYYRSWSTLSYNFLLICDTYDSQFYRIMQVILVMQVTPCYGI